MALCKDESLMAVETLGFSIYSMTTIDNVSDFSVASSALLKISNLMFALFSVLALGSAFPLINPKAPEKTELEESSSR